MAISHYHIPHPGYPSEVWWVLSGEYSMTTLVGYKGFPVVRNGCRGIMGHSPKGLWWDGAKHNKVAISNSPLFHLIKTSLLLSFASLLQNRNE
ncbi:hypothetical protein [Marinoscillum sp. MHG1-6]|uniref:hypothetical protein n=1 Tax=Marinoscillum sp. MHG1-6 TaxID=2959627 RepID=UPI0021578EA1|nr:hypothetical protein [Marinoscillum sp. MHG1-6]